MVQTIKKYNNMNTNNKQYKAKAVIGLCLLLSLSGLTAQNTGTYKYIIEPADTCKNENVYTLEIGDHYYVLSGLNKDFSYPHIVRGFVTVYNKDLNREDQFFLSGYESGSFYPMRFSYDTNYFYVLGVVWEEPYRGLKPCFAKYDVDFNLVPPFIVYDFEEDSLPYEDCEALITRDNNFLFLVQLDDTTSRIFQINKNGDILQNVCFRSPWLFSGTLVETDSLYIRNYRIAEKILAFRKDSLEKNEWISLEWPYNKFHEGEATAVGNKLILANEDTRRYDECPAIGNKEYDWDYDIEIMFLNEDFSFKKWIHFGNPCVNDRWGVFHYINPDSIYYAYESMAAAYEGYTYTISIACFSSEGELHFNYMLDLPDTVLRYKGVYGCRATSDGSVLVWGYADKELLAFQYNGFLLLYHPPKNTGIAPIPTSQLRVYPNPTTNQLRITNYELRNAAAEYSIYSVAGQIVMHGTLQDETSVINLAPLAKGMYFLRVGEKTVKVVRE